MAPVVAATCDISAWDAFLPGHVLDAEHHWLGHLLTGTGKHLAIWSGNVAQFNENSNYLMGWLRDYLWAQQLSADQRLQPLRHE